MDFFKKEEYIYINNIKISNNGFKNLTFETSKFSNSVTAIRGFGSSLDEKNLNTIDTINVEFIINADELYNIALVYSMFKALGALPLKNKYIIDKIKSSLYIEQSIVDFKNQKLKKDIDYFLSLDIPHISCYSLIIEDNTLLKINNYQNIDEDIEYEMYKYIENKLTSNGYIHYEISNYAKEGYKSTHNINYWDNGSYYGFGLGSVSYIDNYRISNTKNISKYNKGIFVSNREYEDMNTNMSNDMILGLRKIKGVSISKFYNKYKKDIREVFDIDDLINNKILIIDNDNMYIDSKYIYLSNQVLIRFIK